MIKLIEFLQSHLKQVVLACYGVLAVVAILGFVLVNHEEANSAIERLPGFWAVFGFVACVLIIILSKWFGHAGIMTREDYYDQKPPRKS